MKPTLSIVLAATLFLAGCGDGDEPEVEFSPAVERIELAGMASACRSSTVLLGSQPDESALSEAKERYGVATVVNLRLPEETNGGDEADLVRSLGMSYVNIPFKGPETLTDGVFGDVREVLRDPSRRPLLLHCSSGNRAGAVWYAYRRLDQGISHERALYEARLIGLKNPGHEQRALDYVKPHRSD